MFEKNDLSSMAPSLLLFLLLDVDLPAGQLQKSPKWGFMIWLAKNRLLELSLAQKDHGCERIRETPVSRRKSPFRLAFSWLPMQKSRFLMVNLVNLPWITSHVEIIMNFRAFLSLCWWTLSSRTLAWDVTGGCSRQTLRWSQKILIQKGMPPSPKILPK